MAKSRTYRVKLTYPQCSLDKPILYGLITQFDVIVNVVEASVSPEGGWLILDMTGSAAAILTSLDWAAEEGIQVEHLSRA